MRWAKSISSFKPGSNQGSHPGLRGGIPTGWDNSLIKEGKSPLSVKIKTADLREVAHEPQVGKTDRHLHSPHIRGPAEPRGDTTLRVQVQGGVLQMVSPSSASPVKPVSRTHRDYVEGVAPEGEGGLGDGCTNAAARWSVLSTQERGRRLSEQAHRVTSLDRLQVVLDPKGTEHQVLISGPMTTTKTYSLEHRD